MMQQGMFLYAVGGNVYMRKLIVDGDPIKLSPEEVAAEVDATTGDEDGNNDSEVGTSGFHLELAPIWNWKVICRSWTRTMAALLRLSHQKRRESVLAPVRAVAKQ
jgi:hypothetical protein